ncbi:hypothetical protein [Paenibacillus sp. BK033]|uniref:hypothetical protein n=1 Tax=Paenibacillus sp. BK033 TaxID=2512133 RepID=UPI001048FB68|nr:hypothetical protein [Paenibacillus sp. BK033]
MLELWDLALVMPWTRNDFDQLKGFLLSVINSAMKRHRGEKLNCSPKEEKVVSNLNHLRLLATNFTEEFVDEAHYINWSTKDDLDEAPTIPIGFPQCSKHKVILSCYGCLICNNGTQS